MYEWINYDDTKCICMYIVYAFDIENLNLTKISIRNLWWALRQPQQQQNRRSSSERVKLFCLLNTSQCERQCQAKCEIRAGNRETGDLRQAFD